MRCKINGEDLQGLVKWSISVEVLFCLFGDLRLKNALLPCKEMYIFLHKASELDKIRVYKAMSLFCKAVQKISDHD